MAHDNDNEDATLEQGHYAKSMEVTARTGSCHVTVTEMGWATEHQHSWAILSRGPIIS